MKITIIGATSRTGRHLVAQAALQGHKLTAFSRHPAELAGDSRIAQTVGGDGRDFELVRRAITGADAVIVIVNGGTRKDPHRYADVCRNVTRAMSETGVARLLVTSAYPLVATKPRLAITLLRRIFAIPYADAAAMETIVSTSGLNWTIARLNRLTTKRGTDTAIITHELLDKARPLARADAAAALLQLVDDPTAFRTALNIGGGPTTSHPNQPTHTPA